MGQLRVLDSTGDTVVAWALEDTDAVRQAEELFDRLVGEECRMAFARPAAGTADDAVLIRSFDPSAEEILVVRPIQGGLTVVGYEVLEDLGPDRQLIRIASGDRAGMELVLVGRGRPGVRRLDELLGDETAPLDGRFLPSAAADRLLRSLLDDIQRSDWATRHAFDVPTPFGRVQLGRLYDIRFFPTGVPGPLHLCVVPTGHRSLPGPDIWANLLLVLRTDPRWFFTVANWRRPGGPWNVGPVPLAPADALRPVAPASALAPAPG